MDTKATRESAVCVLQIILALSPIHLASRTNPGWETQLQSFISPTSTSSRFLITCLSITRDYYKIIFLFSNNVAGEKSLTAEKNVQTYPWLPEQQKHVEVVLVRKSPTKPKPNIAIYLFCRKYLCLAPFFFSSLLCLIKPNIALQEYSNPTTAFGDFTAQMQIAFSSIRCDEAILQEWVFLICSWFTNAIPGEVVRETHGPCLTLKSAKILNFLSLFQEGLLLNGYFTSALQN